MTVVWHHEHGIHTRHTGSKQGSGRLWYGFALSVLVIIVIIGGGWFYWKGWKSGIIPPSLERILVLPIGREDGHTLWFSTIIRLAHGIAAADNRSAVTDADLAQAIHETVQRNAEEDLAKTLGISVSDADVQSKIPWTSEIRALQQKAGWSDDEYLQFIERDFMLVNALNAAVLQDESLQAPAQKDLTDIQEKLARGIAFPDVAQQFSQDPATAQTAGSFGYVLPNEVDEAFVSVFSLPPFTTSPIITTKDAYWLLRTEETVDDLSGHRTLLRGIAVKKRTLPKILEEKTSTIVPTLWVR